MERGKSKGKDFLKRIFVLFLCILLVSSPGNVWTMSNVYAAEPDADPEDPNEDPKDVWGFSNKIPKSFNANDRKNPYGEGKQPIGIKHETYISWQEGGDYDAEAYNFDDAKAFTGVAAPNSDDKKDRIKHYGGSRDGSFLDCVAYDADNDGKKNYIAEVELKYSGKNAYVNVFRRNCETNDKFQVKYWLGDGGDVDHFDNIEQWAYKGYFNITAGDFNGDGKDELAFYFPRRYREKWGDAAGPQIKILDGKTLECLKTISLIDVVGEVPFKLTEKYTDGKNTARAMTQCTLDSADIDRDGYDDLVATTAYCDIKEDNDSKPFEYRYSKIKYYRGNKDSLLVGSSKCDLTTPGMEDPEGQGERVFDMRECNVTCGDLDYDGFPEIVVAGYYNYRNKDLHVGDQDRVRPGHYLVATLGCERDKEGNPTTKLTNPSFQFLKCNAFIKDGVGEYNNKQEMHGPPALCAVAMNGMNAGKSIFLCGTFYDYSGGSLSEVKTTSVCSESDKGIGSVPLSRTWVQDAVAGNFDSNPLGVEQVLYVTGYQRSGVQTFTYRVNYAGYTSENVDGAERVAIDDKGNYIFNESGTKNGKSRDGREYVSFTHYDNGPAVCIAAIDCDDDTTIFEYTGKEYTFARPQVLALLQAAPYFGDLDEAGYGYGDNCGSSIGKSFEDGHTTSTTSSVHAGAAIAFDLKAGGFAMSAELSFTHEWGWEHEDETTTSWTWEFENTGKSNKVVMIRTPVIQYYYDVTSPDENGKLQKSHMSIGIQQKPSMNMMTVDRYNELVKADKNKTKDDLITVEEEGCVVGQPSSYPTSNLNRDNFVSSDTGPISVNNWDISDGSGSSSMSFEKGTGSSDSQTYNNEVDLTAKFGVGVTGTGYEFSLMGGPSIGGSWGGGETTSHMETVTKSGTVAYPPDAQGYQYGFDWQLCTWSQTIGPKDKKTTFPVIGFLVKNVVEPLSIPRNVTVTEVKTDSISIAWDQGYMKPDGYDIYQYIDDPVTGEDYAYIDTVDGDTTTFTYSGLQPETEYGLCIRAFKLTQSIMEYSMITAPVFATTLGLSEIPIISKHPEDQYALYGQTALFSVTARPSENATELSYSWQRKTPGTNKWENIGVRTSTLRLKDVTDDMDGLAYRVIVGELLKGTSSKVNAYSNPAILHVGKSTTQTTVSALNSDTRTDNTFRGQNRGLSAKTEYYNEYTEDDVPKEIDVNIGDSDHHFTVYKNAISDTPDPAFIYRDDADGNYYGLIGLNEDETEASAMVRLEPNRAYFVPSDGNEAAGAIWAGFNPDDLKYVPSETQTQITYNGETYDVYQYEDRLFFKHDDPSADFGHRWYVFEGSGYDGYELIDVTEDYYANTDAGGDSPVIVYDSLMGYDEDHPQLAEPLKVASEEFRDETYLLMKPEGDAYSGDAYNAYVSVFPDGKYYYKGSTTIGGMARPEMIEMEVEGPDGIYTGQSESDGNLSVITAVPGDIAMTKKTITEEKSKLVGGDKATLTAQVTAAGEGASVQAPVEFYVRNTDTDASDQFTVQADSSGMATHTWTPESPGIYEITVLYGGNDTTGPSTDSTIYYALDGDLENPDNAVLYNLDGNDSVYGDPITLSLNMIKFVNGRETRTDISGERDSVTYSVAYTGQDGSAREETMTDNTFTPVATGKHVFTATIKGEGNADDIKVSFTTTVTKRPITLTAPTKKNLSSATSSDKIPQMKDVSASYDNDASEDAILASDKNKFKLEDLLDLTAQPTIDADSPAGTYITKLDFKTGTDGAPEPLVNEFKALYSPTLATGEFIIEAGVFNVNFEAGSNGTVRGFQGDRKRSFNSGAKILEGTQVTISAIPDEKFMIDSWTVLDGEGNELTEGQDYTISKDKSDLTFKALSNTLNIKATFTPSSYDLEFSAKENGKIHGNYYNKGEEGAKISSPETIPAGKSVKLTAEPDEGYVVKQWTILDEKGKPQVYTENGDRYTADYLIIDKMDKDYIASVEFEPEETYTVTTSVVDEAGRPVPECSIRVEGANEDGTVKKGKSLEFFAVLPDVPERDIVKEWRQYTSDTDYKVLQGNKDSYRVSSVQSDLHIEIEVAKFGTVALHFEAKTDDGKTLTDVITATANGGTLSNGGEYAKFIEILFEASNIPDKYQVVKWTSRTKGTSEKIIAEGADSTTCTFSSLEQETWVTLYLEGRVNLTYSAGDHGNLTCQEFKSGDYFNKYRKDDFTFVIKPEKGFEPDAVTINGNYLSYDTDKIAGSSDMTLMVRAPKGGFNGDVDVQVSFKEIPKTEAEARLYNDRTGTHGTIEASVSRNGAPEYADSVAAAEDAVQIENIYRDSQLSIISRPEDGYSVRSWNVNGEDINPNDLPDGFSLKTTKSADDTLVITVTQELIDKGEIKVVAQNSLSGGILKFGAKDNIGGSVTAFNNVDKKNVRYGTIFGSDAEVIFTATAEESYELVDWEVNGKSQKADGKTFTYTVSGTEDTEVRAVFKQPVPVETKTVTFAAVTDDGQSHGGLRATVSKMPEAPGKGYYSTADYKKGDIIDSGKALDVTTGVAFRAEADGGFRIAGWYSDEACTRELFDGSEEKSSYEISSLTEDSTVYVKFIPIEDFTIKVTKKGTGKGTYSVAVNGKTLKDEQIVNGEFKVSRHDSVLITAKPEDDSNYVSAWNDKPTGSKTFEIADVLSDQNVSVTFSPMELMDVRFILPEGYDSEEGSVKVNGEDVNAISKPVRLIAGKTVVFAITPHEGQMIHSWKVVYGDGTVTEGSKLGLENSLTLKNLNTSATVFVTLESIVTHHIPTVNDDTDTYDIKTVTPTPDVVNKEDEVRDRGMVVIEISPSSDYEIDEVIDHNTNENEKSNIVEVKKEDKGRRIIVTISNIRADVDLEVKTSKHVEQVEQEEKPSKKNTDCTVRTRKDSRGKIIVKNSAGKVIPSGKKVPKGTRLTITAKPAAGCEFTVWNKPLSGPKKTTTLKVTSDVTLKATFTRLPILTKVTVKENSAVIRWGKVAEAERYLVYLQKCDKSKKFTKKVKTTTANVRTCTVKNLKNNKDYKFKVVAQKKVDGRYKTIITCIDGHFVTTANAKKTNAKAVSVNKKSLLMKKGKTFKIKAVIKKSSKSKSLLDKTHGAPIRYKTSNKRIATVNKRGRIKAISTGNCTIYVYAINGVCKKIKVTVK